MAQGRISGRLLRDDLARDTNLTFNTNTLVVDYTNGRVGIGNVSPTDLLTVAGNVTAANIQISNNQILSVNADAHIVLNPNGTGNIDVSSTYINNLADPTQAQDAATKAYVDSQLSASLGNAIQLGTSTDGNLVSPAAYQSWTTTTTVTDAIDDLNEVMLNVYNDTYVGSVDFTADTTSGGAGTAVTLTITHVGNANRYDITWGDGDTTIGTTDTTPTHTYSTNVGSPFDVTVRAYNNGGWIRIRSQQDQRRLHNDLHG